MSLVLPSPRPLSARPLALLASIVALTFVSALSLAPTLAKTLDSANHVALCHCAHCPGGPKCCCRTKLLSLSCESKP